MNSSPQTGLIAAQHQKFGDDPEETDWYWASQDGCPLPTVTVDDSWIEWDGDTSTGWTPTFYISNPSYGSQSSSNIFWWLGVWTKDAYWHSNGQWFTAAELVAGVDLSDLDSNLADTSNCFDNIYPIAGGWCLVTKLMVIYSCESPPEPYYPTGHSLGPAGGNFNGPMMVGGPNNAGSVYANAPCVTSPVYEVEDCETANTWYVLDDQDIIDTSGNSGEYVAWYDASANAHCGRVVATSSQETGKQIYNAVWSSCWDCETSMGI